MFQRIILVCILQSFAALGFNDKETEKAALSPSSKENSYIQIEAKKSKKFEIYTLDGTYVSEGILDFNSRVDVSHLKPGNYLVVVGKKAFQFTVN
ncbi:MAG TPA: T9SS type A sorting domain-containing protein [Cytophagales bacterium]|nr:T9SS type A sorting domain-containing protein [Cytophagales bacterium]